MAAIAWQSDSAAGGTLGADPTVTKPSGVVNDWLMLATGVALGGSTITAPAGWTKHASSVDDSSPLFWKIASGEGSNYTFTVSGSGNSIIVISAYSGVDPANPIDAVSGITGTGTLVIPQLSPAFQKFIAHLAAKVNNTSWTPPGTVTERWDTFTSPGTHAGGDELASGATGTRTWTPASGTNGGVAYMVSLNAPNVNGGGSQAETITLTSTATVQRYGDASRSASVVLSATGSTGVYGAASLSVGANRATTESTINESQGIETVQLTGSGATGVSSGSDQTVITSLSASVHRETYGDAPVTQTVALSATGRRDYQTDANGSVSVGLTASLGIGANAALAAGVGLTASGNAVHESGSSLTEMVSLTASGSRSTYSDSTLTASVSLATSGEVRRYFIPPTQDQSMPDWFWGRFPTPVGISVLKQGGHYVNVPTPTGDELEAAGTEGTDWFRGGYTYEITAEVEAALQADGYL